MEIVSEVNSRSWSVTSLRVAPNSQTLWVNGQVVGAKAYAQGVSAIDFVGENFTGEIAEALVFDQEVNSINREKIEGYLAHKWGMSGDLPDLHSYSDDPLRSVVIKKLYGED